MLNDFGYVLDADELDQGMILACQTRLKTDITVEVTLEDEGQTLAIAKSVDGTIDNVTPLTHDIVEIRITLAKALPAFLAGQYVELSIDGITDPRSYSYARAPSLEDANTISIYVRRVPEGLMSNLLHDGKRLGNNVTVSGPHGSFHLRNSPA